MRWGFVESIGAINLIQWYQRFMMDDLIAFQRDLLYVIAGMEDDPFHTGCRSKKNLKNIIRVVFSTDGCIRISIS